MTLLSQPYLTRPLVGRLRLVLPGLVTGQRALLAQALPAVQLVRCRGHWQADPTHHDAILTAAVAAFGSCIAITALPADTAVDDIHAIHRDDTIWVRRVHRTETPSCLF